MELPYLDPRAFDGQRELALEQGQARATGGDRYLDAAPFDAQRRLLAATAGAPIEPAHPAAGDP